MTRFIAALFIVFAVAACSVAGDNSGVDPFKGDLRHDDIEAERDGAAVAQ